MWLFAPPEDSTMLRARWTLFVLFAFLLVLSALVAQEQPTLPMHFKKLALTKDQEDKILKVRGEYDAKFAALRKQLQELEVQEKAAVEKLLTDAQKAKLKELREPPKDDKTKK
jgi:hypothetical protein